ncbi:bile acid:sodium symporter family protein [Streptomyces sp. CWNU-52B]|uniref:bile acid:sodium symporter family protein n=1 Tax=unclassified Streptomyces TaxID=2593676 RepID=UPI0039C4E3E6
MPLRPRLRLPRRTLSNRTLSSRVDWYVLALLATIGLAAVLPAEGGSADVVGATTTVAIGLLFFVYGARLSPQAAFSGLRHWRLHLPILCVTFVVFPALGLAFTALPSAVLGAELATGLLFLCVLPSTVQSAVAFTSLARGNVAAAICSSSFSSMLGVFLTPLLAAVLLRGELGGGVRFSADQALSVVVLLLVPFGLGQALRPWIADRIGRHRRITMVCDRGSILLVVYSAFSQGVTAGIWGRLSPVRLGGLLVLCALLLALVLTLITWTASRLGVPYEDRVTVVFCGSTKSLASGLPIATVLFAGSDVGLAVLPLMLYHTLQLMVCAAVARRWSRPAVREEHGPAASPAPPLTA